MVLDPTDPARRRQIAAAARRLRLAAHDHSDIRQELTLRLIAESRHFRPERGSPGQFTATVLHSAVASLTRRHFALKRGDQKRLLRWGVGEEPPSRDRGHELAVEVAEVLERLPGELRQLADHLRDGGRIAELARDGGPHRATWQRRLQRLRRAFLEAGFAPEPLLERSA